MGGIKDMSVSVWVPPERIQSSAKRNILCEICHEAISFCSSLDAMCSICNVVAHVNCLSKKQRRNKYRNRWICIDCRDDLDYSKEQYIASRQQGHYESVAYTSQQVIAKTWRRYRLRTLYKRTLKYVVRLQGLARMIHRKNMLMKYRKLLLRPLGVKVICGAQIGNGSAYDTSVYISTSQTQCSTSQIWLKHTDVVQSTCQPFYGEEFLLPGINGEQTLVFTVVGLTGQKRRFLGQAVLDMALRGLWRKGGKFMLPLRSVQYILQEKGVNMCLDYATVEPTGILEVNVTPLMALDNFCGKVYGPSLTSLHTAFRNRSTQAQMKHPDYKPKFGEGCSVEARQIHKASLWLVLSCRRLHLYDGIGEPCRMIIDLKHVRIQIKCRYETLEFEINIEGFPPLKFACADNVDQGRFKAAILSAWRKATLQRFEMGTLVSDLVHIRNMQVLSEANKPNKDSKPVYDDQSSSAQSYESKRKASSFLPMISQKYPNIGMTHVGPIEATVRTHEYNRSQSNIRKPRSQLSANANTEISGICAGPTNLPRLPKCNRNNMSLETRAQKDDIHTSRPDDARKTQERNRRVNNPSGQLKGNRLSSLENVDATSGPSELPCESTSAAGCKWSPQVSPAVRATTEFMWSSMSTPLLPPASHAISPAVSRATTPEQLNDIPVDTFENQKLCSSYLSPALLMVKSEKPCSNNVRRLPIF